MRELILVALVAVSRAAHAQGGDDGWAKYDFVAGDMLLFFEDFAKTDKKLSRLTKPTERLDVQKHLQALWLHCRPPCSFDVVLPGKLPERFTVDFDLHNPIGESAKVPTGLVFGVVNPDGSPLPGAPTATSISSTLSYGNGGGDDVTTEIDRTTPINGDAVLHFSWLFDGKKVKGYVEQFTGLSAPNLAMPRTARLHFEFPGGDDPTLIDQNSEVWLTNLRIAAGGNPAIFDELDKKGRVALQGILFDTGSDRIRPESTPTLLAIAKMLAEHPELKLTVEGHTDNQGKAPANQVLSEKRAAAVKAWLTGKPKIDGARLDPKGFGQTRPAGSNDTAEGRQANRRVELVKR